MGGLGHLKPHRGGEGWSPGLLLLKEEGVTSALTTRPKQNLFTTGRQVSMKNTDVASEKSSLNSISAT